MSSKNLDYKDLQELMEKLISDEKIIEGKEEFKKYLERSGVQGALTDALQSLFDTAETTEDPIEFIKDNMDERMSTTQEEYEELKAQLKDFLDKVNELEMEIDSIKSSENSTTSESTN